MGRGLAPVQYDGSVGAGRDAGVTSVAQVRVDKGRLAGIDLQNRLAATDAARQTLAASLAKIVHYVGHVLYLRFGKVYRRHESLRLCCPVRHTRQFFLHTPGGYVV